MRISLCLIVKNELEGCILELPNLPIHDFSEFYVIDGGSSDGTYEFFKNKNIDIYKQAKIGLNSAYILANAVSKCDFVVVYFPKGTLPVGDLLKFKNYFLNGYDLVIASRLIQGSFNEEDVSWWRPRKWLLYLLSLFVYFLWNKSGNRIFDVLHGFKGWKRKSFLQMNITESGLSIDLEMVVRSYKLGLKQVEFPTLERKRFYGKTNFPIFATGYKLFKYLIYEIFRKN